MFIILSILLEMTLSTTTFTFSSAYYTSFTNPFSDSNLGYPFNLGSLMSGDSITITFNLPNIPTSTELVPFVANNLRLKYVDPNTGDQFAVKDSSGTLFSFPSATSGSTSYSASYSVIFSTASGLTSANFALILLSHDEIFVRLKFVYYYLDVDFTPAPTQGPTGPPSSLLKTTEYMRESVAKVIYVAKDNSVFHFSISNNLIGGAEHIQLISNYIAVSNPTASNLNSLNQYSAQQYTRIYPDAQTGSNPTATYTATLHKGYYTFYTYLPVLSVTPPLNFDFTFDSDPYLCPYDPSYPDLYLIFQPCITTLPPPPPSPAPTPKTPQYRPPCQVYQTDKQVCTKCFLGYALINGSCFADTTCPQRQYYHFGECYNVSNSCGAFDPFTGACLNCSDPTNYNLNNGSCVVIAVTCGPRQWQLGNKCFSISSACLGFDSNTGRCLSCVSNLYKLNSDGTCTQVVAICPQGQYSVKFSCATIPAECISFNETIEKCSSCIKGYIVRNGVCQRINDCPHGQIPSYYDLSCVKVSPLCDSYDQNNGSCLSCKIGYLLRDGKCFKEVYPIAGCKERQDLGFGPCVGADLFCKIFDIINGNCIQCIGNFYIDYTGHCTNSPVCGLRQWSVNGQCIMMTQNCVKVNVLGMCIQCENSSYRIVQGQCVYFERCEGQQYLSSGGQCVSVSRTCATWNPSNGQCITCQAVGVQPSGGVCCAAGQVFFSGKCVNAVMIQISAGPKCILRHPLVNYCLKCADGYLPVYSTPFGCAKH